MVSMKLRKVARRVCFVIFCICVALTAAGIALCIWLVKVLGVFGGVYTLLLLNAWSMCIAPLMILTFITWAILTELRPWIRGMLVAFALTPVVWAVWSSVNSEWMESEFYLAADYNPIDRKIYFISTQEALAEINPPAPPERIKAQTWLERINPDGTMREKLFQVPATARADVNGYPYSGGRYYVSSRKVRLRFAPSYDQLAMDEYGGGIYVINLADKTIHTLAVHDSAGPYSCSYASSFLSWLPDGNHLLLLLAKRTEGDSGSDQVIVSTPALQFEPKVVWEKPQPPPPDIHGRRPSPQVSDELTWSGAVDDNLIACGKHGARLVHCDVDHLAVEAGRPVPATVCGDILHGPHSNLWLSTEGDILNSEFTVSSKLPDLHGDYLAQRVPHAWYAGGIIITDQRLGLQVMDPDSGLTRTILGARIDQRSRIRDQQAYKAHVQANIAWQKEWDAKQRAECEMAEIGLKEVHDAAKLSDRLKSHDTTALQLAKPFLWKDGEVAIVAFQGLFWAKWSEADAVIDTFLLQGTNVLHRYRMLQEIAADVPPPDRFSNTLFQIASDYSTNNSRLVQATLPSLRRIQSPQADACLVDLALKHQDFTIRDSALGILRHRNEALYSQTMQLLAHDQEYTEYLLQEHSKRALPKP